MIFTIPNGLCVAIIKPHEGSLLLLLRGGGVVHEIDSEDNRQRLVDLVREHWPEATEWKK